MSPYNKIICQADGMRIKKIFKLGMSFFFSFASKFSEHLKKLIKSRNNVIPGDPESERYP